MAVVINAVMLTGQTAHQGGLVNWFLVSQNLQKEMCKHPSLLSPTDSRVIWIAIKAHVRSISMHIRDITAIHPVTLQTWVFDVTLSWQELADVAVTALGARNRENWKVRSYAGAMDRRVTEAAEGGAAVPEGWLEHVFMPLGYEATGAWGPKADYAFREVVKAYQATRAGNNRQTRVPVWGLLGASYCSSYPARSSGRRWAGQVAA